MRRWQQVQPYSSTDTAIAWKILDFQIVNCLPMLMLTSFSVDEILVPRYVKWFHLKGIPFK